MPPVHHNPVALASADGGGDRLPLAAVGTLTARPRLPLDVPTQPRTAA